MKRILYTAAVLLFLFGPLAALAQAGDDPVLRPPPGAPGIFSVAASLVLVIGAIFLVGWLYTRAQGIRGGGAGAIRILAAQALGAKERIVVVQVGNKQLVVGVTPSTITTLHAFEGQEVAPSGLAAGGAFAGRLRSVLGSRSS